MGVAVGLEPGTPLILTPSGTPAAVGLAEVLRWSASPAGLVVTAWAATSDVTAEQFDDKHVWMAGRTAEDVLIVLEAVSRRAGPGELELTSVVQVASEYRRSAVRAAVEFPAVLRTRRSGGARRGAITDVTAATAVTGTTVDLSSDGCRLRLATDHSVSVATAVDTWLDLGAAGTVHAPGAVVRTTADGREVIVRFAPLPGHDSAAIDRVVFAALRA